MAKKFVRGITDVKTINNQDFDTNNVNDLLSDGQYNYIHRKKGKNEEYHNLTDNIKTISSDNTELLSVTNNNKTTNTATLSPKHDAQKEQLLESTRDTITINHGTNGTAEKTTVDVNFDKVQAKLTAGDGITIQGQTISASGGGSSYIEILENDEDWTVIEHVETTGNTTIKTFSFDVSAFGDVTINNPLKSELLPFMPVGSKVISGGLVITNHNNILAIANTKNGSESDRQQATFTFLTINESGGEGGGEVIS